MAFITFRSHVKGEEIVFCGTLFFFLGVIRTTSIPFIKNTNELNVCIILGKYIKGNSCGLKYIVVGCCLIAIKESKYIKVHMATRWTIRHGLMLLWFTDLMNVTEEVTIHRPNVSTLLSSAFIRGDLNAATRGPFI